MPAVLSSPTSPYFRNKLSTQIRRVLPIYLVIIVLIIFFANVNSLSSAGSRAHKYKRELRYQPPKQPTSDVIPRKIWQSWKTGPLNFELRDITTARTWPAKNPNYRYEVLTDDNEMAYVEFHYGPGGINRPDIVELYRSINARIIKADLLRYLIMYAEGGVYADIDVEALKPVSRFIPERYSEWDIDMVVGVEIDQPAFGDHPILGPKSQSFCQWTFMCKPRLPVMMRLIEQLQDWLHDLAKKQGVTISELELDFDDVISGSGPSAFTTAILKQMNANNKDNPVEWSAFHDLEESKLVNGFLVLNVEAFAAGQGHSDSGNHDSRGALVKHHYHASGWPSKHPRKNHPVFGEVEQCNWEPFCVAEWDKNVAEFDTLTPDQQQQKIAEENLKKAAPPTLEATLEQFLGAQQPLPQIPAQLPAI